MIRNKRLWIILGVAAVVLAIGVYQSVRIFKDGVQAYLFGYPLVVMDVTREATADPLTGKKLPSNHFVHAVSFPDHNFRGVVRPNNDTLYSSAWFDLSSEPVVMSVPDTVGRYYVMPFMDAWTNVFAMVGKRATGTGRGDYLLVGPDWKGAVPDDVKVINAPTNMLWLIGRIQVNGKNDLQNVYALQKQFKLTPLSHWASRQPNPAYTVSAEMTRAVEKIKKINPSAKVEKMPAGEFFARLSILMGKHPAAKEDAPVMKMLTGFGIVPGQSFKMDDLNFVRRLLLSKAVAVTRSQMKEVAKLRTGKTPENGWGISRKGVGVFGTAYDVRAFVAAFGLGALPPEEAVYPAAFMDGEGKPLNGGNRYRIHFDAGKTPPVDAFWSLTLYDETQFLVDNPIHRYTIGDRDELKYNPDGSLDIFIQRDRPAQRESNWLPAGEGAFSLTMRLYMPKASFMNGQWKLPAVERIDGR